MHPPPPTPGAPPNLSPRQCTDRRTRAPCRGSDSHIDQAEFRFLHKTIIDAHTQHTEKVRKAKQEEERQREKAAQLRTYLWAAMVLIVVLLAGMSGLMVAVVAAFKDTKADGPMLANYEGKVMETSLASINLPLTAAPAMDLQRLAQVSSVSVTLYVMKNGAMPPFLKASVFAEQAGPTLGALARTPRHRALAAP